MSYRSPYIHSSTVHTIRERIFHSVNRHSIHESIICVSQDSVQTHRVCRTRCEWRSVSPQTSIDFLVRVRCRYGVLFVIFQTFSLHANPGPSLLCCRFFAKAFLIFGVAFTPALHSFFCHSGPNFVDHRSCTKFGFTPVTFVLVLGDGIIDQSRMSAGVALCQLVGIQAIA